MCKKYLLSLLSCFVGFGAVYAQTGPGGVGDASTNIVWLRADDLSASPVSAWSDQSGNGNDMSQGNATYQPTWVDGVLNGKPVLRFDGANDDLDGPATNTLLGGGIDDITIITVFRTSSSS